MPVFVHTEEKRAPRGFPPAPSASRCLPARGELGISKGCAASCSYLTKRLGRAYCEDCEEGKGEGGERGCECDTSKFLLQLTLDSTALGAANFHFLHASTIHIHC